MDNYKTSLLTALFATLFCFTLFGQDSGISTMDFVQIVDGNRAETLYYYENNWKAHRENALKKGWIKSYQLLEAPRSEGPEFDIVLITTYANQEQYDKREDNFGELIEAHGERRLMNELQPSEFRKIIFSRDPVRELAGK